MDWVIGIFAAAMFFSLTTAAIIMSYTQHEGDNVGSALLDRKAKQKKESKKHPALDAERREPFIFRK